MSSTQDSKKTNKFGTVHLIIIIILMISMNVVSLLVLFDVIPNPLAKQEVLFGKPVIYLYPTHKQEVSVTLTYKGTIIALYPHYNQTNGWKVEAAPNGELIDSSSQKTYSYLFWEGIPTTMFTLPNQGFVIKGSDTADFLQEKLRYLGLIPKEYNEMIVYWLPRMQNNKYNLIYFAKTDYTDTAKLTIKPKPDSIIRVFMVFKPLEAAISIPEQALKPANRKGFSVIEWGAAELSK